MNRKKQLINEIADLIASRMLNESTYEDIGGVKIGSDLMDFFREKRLNIKKYAADILELAHEHLPDCNGTVFLETNAEEDPGFYLKCGAEKSREKIAQGYKDFAKKINAPFRI